MGGSARPSRSELLREVRDVVADVPVFLTSPLYRHWHRHWGATPEEIAAPLPGDDFLVHPAQRATRAITIAAAPEAVWPWLVQIGCGRAGFYSDDLLDNLGRPSVRTIVPDLQQLEVGQLVPMSPSDAHTDRTAFTVHSFTVDRSLLWAKSDSTWVWRLTPTGDATRLVTRITAVYDWHRPFSALTGVALMEFGDFAMMRRMLRGIKERAESVAGEATVPGLSS